MTDGRVLAVQVQDLYERINSLTEKNQDLVARYEQSVKSLMEEAEKTEMLQAIIDKVDTAIRAWPTQDWYLKMQSGHTEEYRLGMANALSMISQFVGSDISTLEMFNASEARMRVDTPLRAERDRLICEVLGINPENIGSMFLVQKEGYVVWQHLRGHLPPLSILHASSPYTIPWYRIETYRPGQWETLVDLDWAYQEKLKESQP